MLGEFPKLQPFISLIINSSVLSNTAVTEQHRVEQTQLYVSLSSFYFDLISRCRFISSLSPSSSTCFTFRRDSKHIHRSAAISQNFGLPPPSSSISLLSFPKHHSALPSHTEMGPGWREAEEWGGRDGREAAVGKLNKWNKMFWTAGWSNCQEMSSGSGRNCPQCSWTALKLDDGWKNTPWKQKKKIEIVHQQWHNCHIREGGLGFFMKSPQECFSLILFFLGGRERGKTDEYFEMFPDSFQ